MIFNHYNYEHIVYFWERFGKVNILFLRKKNRMYSDLKIELHEVMGQKRRQSNVLSEIVKLDSHMKLQIDHISII